MRGSRRWGREGGSQARRLTRARVGELSGPGPDDRALLARLRALYAPRPWDEAERERFLRGLRAQLAGRRARAARRRALALPVAAACALALALWWAGRPPARRAGGAAATVAAPAATTATAASEAAREELYAVLASAEQVGSEPILAELPEDYRALALLLEASGASRERRGRPPSR